MRKRQEKQEVLFGKRTLAVAQIRNLAEGGYLSRSEPIIFLGKPERVRHTWRRG